MDTRKEIIKIQPEELLTEEELLNVVGGGDGNNGGGNGNGNGGGNGGPNNPGTGNGGNGPGHSDHHSFYFGGG